MKLFFIFNLHAGKNKVKSALPEIIDTMSKMGHEVTLHSTQFKGQAKNIIENLPEGYDRIICAGGDGTLDEVVSGVMARKDKLPIGYIPAGSTNDFAVSLGIPQKMKEAVNTALGDRLFKCDLGNLNGNSFVYVAAFGLFAEVSYETSQDAKNVLGHAAYILEGAQRLKDIKSYRLKVSAGGETIEGEFIHGMITNSESVGGFKNITGNNIDLSDGLFEVTLVAKPKNPADLAEILLALQNRDHKAKGLYYFKTDFVSFECEEEVTWTLDGEFGGAFKETKIINEREKLDIFV